MNTGVSRYRTSLSFCQGVQRIAFDDGGSWRISGGCDWIERCKGWWHMNHSAREGASGQCSYLQGSGGCWNKQFSFHPQPGDHRSSSIFFIQYVPS